MAADNIGLGAFTLAGLPPAPRGIPRIEVTFDLDASGILNVSARDLATGKAQSIQIAGSTRLPEAEKRRMIAEAERWAEADRKRREEVEQLNAAESACYQADQLLAEHGERIAAELRDRVAAAIKEVREALARKDATAAARRAEALRRLLQEAGATLYASRVAGPGSPSGGGTGPAEGAGSGGRVVEAEYREGS